MDYMTYVQQQGMKTPKGRATPHAAGALFDVCRNIVLYTLDIITEHGLINVPQELYEKIKGLRHTWKGEAKKPVSVQCSGMTQKKERCKRKVRVDKDNHAAVCSQHDPSKILYSPSPKKGGDHKPVKNKKKKKDDFVWGDSASWSIVLGYGPNGTQNLTHQNLLEISGEFGYHYLNGEWSLLESKKGAELKAPHSAEESRLHLPGLRVAELSDPRGELIGAQRPTPMGLLPAVATWKVATRRVEESSKKNEHAEDDSICSLPLLSTHTSSSHEHSDKHERSESSVSSESSLLIHERSEPVVSQEATVKCEKEETLEDHVKISFVRLCRNIAKNHEYTKVIDMITAKEKEVSTDVSHPLRAFLRRDLKNEIWDAEEQWEKEGKPCTAEQKRQISEYLAEKEKQREREEQVKFSTERKEEEERESERSRRANRKQCDIREIKRVEIGTDHVHKSDWKIMGVQMKEIILVREGLINERKTLLQICKEVQAFKEGKILTLSQDEDSYLLGLTFRNIDSLRQQDYTSVFHVLKTLPTKDYIPIGTINLFDYIEDLCNMYVPDQLLWDILHGDELLE